MNVDFLKRKPIPKQKKGFDIFLDQPEVIADENKVETENNNQEKEEDKQYPLIVDKRGEKEINRSDIMKRLHGFKYNKPIEETKEMIVVDEPKDEEPEPKDEEPEHKDEEPEHKEDDDNIVISEMPVKKGRKLKEGNIDKEAVAKGIETFKKILPKENDKILVKTSSYYMNNRKIFNKKINELFKDYLKDIQSDKSEISCSQDNNDDFSLLTHQKIVRDYLNIYTPYRGLLLYHGLGSGKTCSSIALAEGMKTDKKIVVLTPASLKMNFFSELKKCGDLLFKKNQYWEFVSIEGKPENVEILHKTLNISREYIRKKKGAWMVNINKQPNFSTLKSEDQDKVDHQLNEMIRVKYMDLNYNGLNMKALERITGKFSRNPFDNCVLVIDEAHNFVSRIINKLNKKKSLSYMLYDYIMNAQNAKVILLSGTPIINKPNEISIMFNMLRGYIKTWSFDIKVNTESKINKDTILEMFDKEGLKTFDFVEYSGNKLQITRNPFGFVNVKKRGVTRGTQKMKGGDGEKEKEEVDEELLKKGDDGFVVKDNEDNTTDEEVSSEDEPENPITNKDLSEAQKDIAEKQYNTIEELENKVNELTSKVKDLSETNQVLERSIVNKSLENDKLRNTSSDLESELQEYKNKEEEEEGEEKEDEDEEDEDEDEEKEDEDEDEEKEDELTELKKKVSTLEYDLYDLTKKNEELTSEKEKLDKEEEELENKDNEIEEQKKMIEEQKKIIEEQNKLYSDIQEEITALKEKNQEIEKNSDIQKEKDALRDEQEKELQRELKKMEKDKEYKEEKLKQLEQDLEEEEEEEEKGKKGNKGDEKDEETLYGRFEKGVDNTRDFFKKQFGIGGKENMKGGSSKTRKAHKKSVNTTKKNNKLMIIPKIPITDEEIEDEASARKYYQMGNNGIYNPYYGGSGLFDKYNGVKLDSTGNMSDDKFQEKVIEILKKNKLEIIPSSITVTNYKCLPDGDDEFNNLFITDGVDGKQLKNVDLMKRRILGLTSYFRSAQEQLMPKLIKTDEDEKMFLVKTQMSEHQFALYEKVRKVEAEEEKRRKKQKAKGKNDDDFSSTYRIFSRALCNFAFPMEIERPMPNADKDGDVNEDMFDGIKKKEIMGRDDYNPEDEGDIKEDVSYQKRIVKALKELSKKDKYGKYTYLNNESLSMYSPKFVEMINNLQHPDNKGKHLIYSQFRTIEGIGIIRLILLANGYAEFKVKKNTSTGKWSIIQNIGDEEKPKFVLYTGTETSEEKELIRNIYNNNWKVIPEEITTQLHKVSKNNLYGEIIKVFMITASGAEGISLKDTRFVHIMEPYWHMVRPNQVIGRARRICSHEDLPKNLRTVKVYMYLSVLSEEQKTSEKHIELRIRDVSKIDGVTPITTDETLFETASLKENINNQVLDAVKSSSFDCNLYATKRNDEKVVCYNFGNIKSNDFGSHPIISIDQTFKELNVKTIRWVAQKITYRRKDYALNKETNEIYDMESYNNAVEGTGELIKMGKLEYINNKPKFVFDKK